MRDVKAKGVLDLLVNLSVGKTCSRKDVTIFLNVKFNHGEYKKKSLCFRSKLILGVQIPKYAF